MSILNYQAACPFGRQLAVVSVRRPFVRSFGTPLTGLYGIFKDYSFLARMGPLHTRAAPQPAKWGGVVASS
eukprot:scaffold37695_cov34-Prasinocladus_malaysianus.AAC.1